LTDDTNVLRADFSPLPLTGFVHTRTTSVRIVSGFGVVDLHENAPQLRLPIQPYSTEKESFLEFGAFPLDNAYSY
jgi:hypothetical protein